MLGGVVILLLAVEYGERHQLKGDGGGDALEFESRRKMTTVIHYNLQLKSPQWPIVDHIVPILGP